ncbi:hypothetical protein GHN41_22880 [Pseudomonas helleri]|uniref:DUF1330 domain-containing protein n=1 Tax=Pseudomonas helleri TaxID=1608996 RepID=A0A6G1WBJ7_9PSED|nr:hypothetical protein [Pseudomonas helleri]MQT28446.1 hypothetical protein [Pseudomonas helleri]MQU19265.1 hypothetical protein [Pseudomonas helleri]
MSYLVYCTFDLKNASAKDYENAYADLQRIGLAKVVKADEGPQVVIPTTSTMGFFNGASAAAVRHPLQKETISGSSLGLLSCHVCSK